MVVNRSTLLQSMLELIGLKDPVLSPGPFLLFMNMTNRRRGSQEKRGNGLLLSSFVILLAYFTCGIFRLAELTVDFGVSKVRASAINALAAANADEDDPSSFDYSDVPSRAVLKRMKYEQTKRPLPIEKVLWGYYLRA